MTAKTGKRVSSDPSNGCRSVVMLKGEVDQATTPSAQRDVSLKLHSTCGLSLKAVLNT